MERKNMKIGYIFNQTCIRETSINYNAESRDYVSTRESSIVILRSLLLEIEILEEDFLDDISGFCYESSVIASCSDYTKIYLILTWFSS